MATLTKPKIAMTSETKDELWRTIFDRNKLRKDLANNNVPGNLQQKAMRTLHHHDMRILAMTNRFRLSFALQPEIQATTPAGADPKPESLPITSQIEALTESSD